MLEQVFREDWGRVLASLVGFLGDIELAEDAVQEAFAAAAERWPRDGQPKNPTGWLITTARNRAIDRLLHGGSQMHDYIGLGRQAVEYELVRNVCASEVEVWMHQQVLHIFESPGTEVGGVASSGIAGALGAGSGVAARGSIGARAADRRGG